MRAEFSKATKLAAWRRAKGHCENEKCKAPLAPEKFHFDHINPSEFSGDASVENCAVLCIGCHSAKTALQDAPAIAKSSRIRNRHIGIRKDRKILAWRNFSGEIVRKPRRRDRE